MEARGGRIAHVLGDFTDEIAVEIGVQHALVTAVADHEARRLKAAVHEDLVRIGQRKRRHAAAEDLLEFAIAAENEDPVRAVAVHDVDVAIRSHIAVRELEALADFVRRELAGGDGQDDFAVELGLDDLLLAQNGGEEVFTIAILANDEAVERLRQLQRLLELAVWSIDLDAGVRLLHGDVNVARAVHGDLAMAVADGFLAGRRRDEVRDEFVGDFGSGAAGECHDRKKRQGEFGHEWAIQTTHALGVNHDDR